MYFLRDVDLWLAIVLTKSTELASDLLIDYIIRSPLQIVTAGHTPAEEGDIRYRHT
jgi:hypothetical protein